MVMEPSPLGSEGGVWLPGDSDAQRVYRRARGEKERREIRAPEGEIGRYLGRADDTEPRPVGSEAPRPSGPRAVDAPFDVHLHAVRHSLGLVGGHVGEDPPPGHLAAGIELEDMDVLGPARVRHVEATLVGRERQAIRVLEVGHETAGAVWRDAIDARVG